MTGAFLFRSFYDVGARSYVYYYSSMRLKYFASAIFVLLVPMFSGCRRSESSKVISAIPIDASGSLYVTEHAGMAHAAARHGMKVYWNGPRGGDDTEQQIELVERAIEQRNAGIVLTPAAAFALDTAIQRALSKKIPVVILGAPIPFPPNANLSFVLTNLDRSAQLAAERICSGPGKSGEVAMIGIDPVMPGSAELVSSFEQALARCGPGISVVSEVGGAATYGQGEMTTARILRDHPKLIAIYALNSAGARGAATALEALHRNGVVRLLSTDRTLELLLLLRRGTVDGLVVPNMRAMGEQAVENIVALDNHRSVQPVMLFEPVLITRENVDTEEVQTLLKMDWRPTP
jgi:ribose transport system substrate-binding protein